MNKREAVVVSAYTGVLMSNLADLQDYVEEVMERPFWTHEMGDKSFAEELKELAKPEFLEICAGVTD